MQADVLESQPKYFGKRHYRDYNKYQGKPPQAAAPGILGAPPAEEAKPKWEDKWTTLRAQRRAQGLCMKCGEKWGRNHKCPDKVSLHILEEVMDLFPEPNKSEPTSDESSEDEVFSLSQAATVGVQGRKTIKITGLVNSQEILILIDSGSSSSFLSQKTADTLKRDLTSAPPVTVTVANGEKILSQ